MVVRRRPGTGGREIPSHEPCPVCREPNRVTAVFCQRCGADMHPAPVPPGAAPAAAPAGTAAAPTAARRPPLALVRLAGDRGPRRPAGDAGADRLARALEPVVNRRRTTVPRQAVSELLTSGPATPGLFASARPGAAPCWTVWVSSWARIRWPAVLPGWYWPWAKKMSPPTVNALACIERLSVVGGRPGVDPHAAEIGPEGPLHGSAQGVGQAGAVAPVALDGRLGIGPERTALQADDPVAARETDRLTRVSSPSSSEPPSTSPASGCASPRRPPGRLPVRSGRRPDRPPAWSAAHPPPASR